MARNDVKKEGAKDYHAQKKFVSDVLTCAKEGDVGLLQQLLKDLEARHPGSCASENLAQIRDAHQRTALHFGASSGKCNIVQFILEQAPEAVHWKDEEDSTALIYAAKEDEYAIVKLLVQNKSDVNQATKNGKTAMHDAAANGSLRTVKLLADAGATLEGQTASGTPLHWAVSENRGQVVDQLLVLKANVDATNSNGLTPLFLACLMRKTKLAQALLQYGAALEPTIMGGVTVVHMAAETGYCDILELFLRVQFERTKTILNCPTEAGATPLQLAAGMGHLETVHLLQPLTQGVGLHQLDSVIATETTRAERELEVARVAAAQDIENRHPAINVPTVAQISVPQAKQPFSEADEQGSVQAKEDGNKAFGTKEYGLAIEWYTKAIELNPTEPKLYGNRCAAYLAAGDALKALYDIRVAQKLDPTWTKAFFREGQCLESLALYEEAANAFWEVLKVNPDDKRIKNRFNQCVKCARQEFSKSQEK